MLARVLAASAILVLVGAVGLGAVGGAASAAASPSGVDGDVLLGVDGQTTTTTTGVSTSGQIGFHGDSTGPNGAGLYGTGPIGLQGTGSEVGVVGVGLAAGVGVHADNDAGGVALQVSGRATFSTSGVATVKSGKSSVTVSAALTRDSLVLATLQTFNAGFSVAAAVPNVGKGTFTIHLNQAATTNMKVAWFVVN
jgi:hypothetical protein